MSSYGVKDAQSAHAWYKFTRNVGSLIARLAVLVVGRPGGPPPETPSGDIAGAKLPARSASQAVAASNATRYLLR